MGTLMVPADMYSVLAAELMIWSMACIAKLKVMNSTTGRNPAIAAPQLIPVNPAWAIVVEAQQSRAETGRLRMCAVSSTSCLAAATCAIRAALYTGKKLSQVLTSVMGVSLTRIAPCFCKRPLVICMHPRPSLLNGTLKQVDKSVLSNTHLVSSLVLSNLHR